MEKIAGQLANFSLINASRIKTARLQVLAGHSLDRTFDELYLGIISDVSEIFNRSTPNNGLQGDEQVDDVAEEVEENVEAAIDATSSTETGEASDSSDESSSTASDPTYVPGQDSLRRYRCNYRDCAKSYQTKKGLLGHKKTHTATELFYCNWQGCDHWSVQRYQVVRHVKKAHLAGQLWAGLDKESIHTSAQFCVGSEENALPGDQVRVGFVLLLSTIFIFN